MASVIQCSYDHCTINRLQSTLKDVIVSSVQSHPALVSLSDQLKLQAKDSNRKVKEVSLMMFP